MIKLNLAVALTATAVKTRPTLALKIATGGKGKKKGKAESIMYIPENSLSCLATDADYAEWEAEETANHRIEELERRFEAEQTANHSIDELERRLSRLETMIGELNGKVKAINLGLDDNGSRMHDRVAGIEDYLGLPEGEIQSLILWDGQHRDRIRNMRGPEYQARIELREQEYEEEYEVQEWDNRSPTPPTPATTSSPAPAVTSAPATTSAPAPATTSAPAPVADAMSAPASVPPVQTPQVVVIPATPESSQEQINNLNQVGHLSVPPPPVSPCTSSAPHPPPPSASISAPSPQANVSAEPGMPPPLHQPLLRRSPRFPTPAPEVLMPPPRQPSPSSLRRSPRLNTPAPEESGDPMDIDA